MKKIIYPGSFGPPTNGHKWMIEQGAAITDELVVAIGINPQKPPCVFSVDERIEMLKGMSKDYPNVKVDHYGKKLLADYARSIDAEYVLRGIRSEEEYQKEREDRDRIVDLNPKLKGIFMMPPKNIRSVSSSYVMGYVGYDDWEKAVKMYVPDAVYKKILEKFDHARTKR